MVKTIKKIRKPTIKGRIIQYFMSIGKTNAEICKILKVPKTTVSYYRKRPIELEAKRKSKIPQEYLKEIISMASNKTTGQMSGGRIANKINRKLKDNNVLNEKTGKLISITPRGVNKILKKNFKLRTVKTVFYMTDEQKKKRVEFCKKILNMGIGKKNILFTDETKIDTAPSTRTEKIRLSSWNEKKLKKGDPKPYKLMNRPKKKFEKSIMVAGGISYYGLTDLILLDGTMNEFSYSQALKYYKENYDEFLKKNKKIYFEQDGAKCHTSKSNLKLIKELFGDNLIQNCPNSPDIAYPIETLWAKLKKNVGARNPKNIKDLKKFTLEEWNNISKKEIKNQFKHFIEKCKKIIDLDGEKLEDPHLQEIRKEEEEESEDEEESIEDEEEEDRDENKEEKNKEDEDDEEEKEEKDKNKLKFKIIFNEEALKKKAKKEISFLRKKIKAKKKENIKIKKQLTKLKKINKRRDLTQSLTKNKEIKIKKDIEIQNNYFKISFIKNLIKKDNNQNKEDKEDNMKKYFNYFKDICDLKKRERTASTSADEKINEILKIKSKLQEYEENFYKLEIEI